MNKFDEALDIIRARGWCQNVLEDSEGHVCAFGALNVATNGTSHYSDWTGGEYHSRLTDVACTLFPDRIGGGAFASAADVNNHSQTTQEDVELMLKHASYEWDLAH